MESSFDKYARKGNDFINELAVKLDHRDDQAMAMRKLKAVLHTLRNHLTSEESIQLLAQLPMFLKAVYVDKWSFKKKAKRTKHLDEFYQEIQDVNKQTSQLDFPHLTDASKATEVIMHMLKRYISDGELKDMQAVMPKKLKVIFNLNEHV